MGAKKLPIKKPDDFDWEESGMGIIHGPHNFVIAERSAAECNAPLGRRIYTGAQVCVLLHGASIQTCGPADDYEKSVASAKQWIVDHMRGVANVYTGRGRAS